MATEANSETLDIYENFWYAACVQHSCEKIVASQIGTMVDDSLDTWVATVVEEHKLSRGKTKTVDRVLLPTFVFFRFPVKTKRDFKYAPILEIKKLSKVHRLVMEPGHDYGEWEGAHIPNNQIERLKFMLEMSDNPVEINTEESYVAGDEVRVIRGSLRGMKGKIKKDDKGGDRLFISVDGICWASTTISRLDVELVKRGPGRPRKTAAKKQEKE